MQTRTRKEVAAIVLGIFFVLIGTYQIILPVPGLVLHLEYGRGYIPEWVTKEGSRAYGCLGVAVGAGLLLFARWPRFGAKRSAIEDYFWRLSQELWRHFGARKYYGVEEVSRVAAECGLNMAFIAYAHAMFCSRADFERYYTPLRVACTYDGLRTTISRKYLNGALGFDAATIVRIARPPTDAEAIQEHHIHDTGGG